LLEIAFTPFCALKVVDIPTLITASDALLSILSKLTVSTKGYDFNLPIKILRGITEFTLA
jgi:hypothetical protein